MLDNIIIREFTTTDKQLVIDFFDQMSGETRSFFDRGSCNRNGALEFFEKEVKNKVFFLAEYEGEMVGYVFFYQYNKSIPWLGISVNEQLKGKHLGRKLIEYAQTFARKNNKGGIMLTTHIANLRGQGLYERMGFERLGICDNGEILYIWCFEQ